MTTGELGSAPVDEAWSAARLSKRTTDVLVGRLHQTLDDIGAEVGLTRERVRQIERDGSRSLLRALETASPTSCTRPSRPS